MSKKKSNPDRFIYDNDDLEGLIFGSDSEAEEIEANTGDKRWFIRLDRTGFVALRPVYHGDMVGDAVVPIEEGEDFGNIPFAHLYDGMVLEEGPDGTLREVGTDQLLAELDNLPDSLD